MTYQLYRLKALVVEDHAPMRKLMGELLTAFGVGNVSFAQNAEEGLQKYHSFAPDIIFTDWMMGSADTYDGLDMVRAIRKDQNGPNRYVPIVLVTGRTQQASVEEARDAGVTEFLAKPFSSDAMYKRLAHIVEAPRDFVKTSDFFGPDRRRNAPSNYNGPLRRRGETTAFRPMRDINPEDIAFIEADTLAQGTMSYAGHI